MRAAGFLRPVGMRLWPRAGRRAGGQGRQCRHTPIPLGLVLAVFVLVLAAAPAAFAITLPPGFDDEPVATLPTPTAFDFTPDGRIVVASKAGQVRIVEDGTLLPTPALDLNAAICNGSERGLLGVAIDPLFASNRFVYLYYTFKKYGVCDNNVATSPVNRVSRFALGDDNLIDPLSELVLIDGIPSQEGVHNAGDVQFGKDGLLYASTGDGGCDFRGDSGCYLLNDSARDLGALGGKILRVTRNGSIPGGNPYQGAGTVRCTPAGFTSPPNKCREIFASGLRNPFRTAFDQNAAGTRFFINDVGADKWEEVDEGASAADYGWNVREGHCLIDSYSNCGPQPAGMTNPIYDYSHTAGCTSITAGDFVPNLLWPAAYDSSYLYGDLVCGKLFSLKQNGGGAWSSTEFASGIMNLIDGHFGPNGSSQAFYYITWQSFPNDEIRRIVFTGTANQSPTASASANPTSGDAPLLVNFDGTASDDPDEDPLTYDWDFGDGSPHATTATPSHTYTSDGTYFATLTVDDGRGGSDSTTVRIDVGNDPPVVSIQSPTPSQLFRVGEQIFLTGSATDPEDGPLPSSALSWRVERHHATHTHPYLEPTPGNNVQIEGPEPEGLLAATNSYLEIHLTATDSAGLSATVDQNMNPKTVDLTFASQPPNQFNVELAGSTVQTPATVTSWDNWSIVVNAPDQADPNGRYFVWDHWSTGGGQTHSILTPSSPASYTAYFKVLEYPRPGGATPLRVPLMPSFSACTAPNVVHVAPLSYPSCSNAAQTSSQLTIAPYGVANSFARYAVVVGNPSTPADEGDVMVRLNATDVRRRSDGQDYTGKVILTTVMHRTDKAGGPSGVQPVTTVAFDFAAPVDCVATASVSSGSTCNLQTTVDALLPNFAIEGKRAVMSAPTIRVDDAGPDGIVTPTSDPLGFGCPPTCGSGDESVFLSQGVFTP